MDNLNQYADEQPPETAAAVLEGISGPYTNLKKKRDEGNQFCSFVVWVIHFTLLCMTLLRFVVYQNYCQNVLYVLVTTSISFLV